MLLGIYSISLVTHPIALVCAFPFFLFSNSSIAITQPLLEMNQWFGRLKVWENRFCSPFSKSNLLSPPHSVTTHTSSFNVLHHQGHSGNFSTQKMQFKIHNSKWVLWIRPIILLSVFKSDMIFPFHKKVGKFFDPILTTVQDEERDKRSLSQSGVNNDTLLHA